MASSNKYWLDKYQKECIIRSIENISVGTTLEKKCYSKEILNRQIIHWGIPYNIVKVCLHDTNSMFESLKIGSNTILDIAKGFEELGIKRFLSEIDYLGLDEDRVSVNVLTYISRIDGTLMVDSYLEFAKNKIFTGNKNRTYKVTTKEDIINVLHSYRENLVEWGGY